MNKSEKKQCLNKYTLYEAEFKKATKQQIKYINNYSLSLLCSLSLFNIKTFKTKFALIFFITILCFKYRELVYLIYALFVFM